MKDVLLTILLCLFAIEVPADSWDEGNFKPYNTDVVMWQVSALRMAVTSA